jgi:ubiquinone/menaquinone biosynthesis C-methylase UbiE
MPTYAEVIQRWIPEVEYHQNRYARGLATLVHSGKRWLDIGAGTRPHAGWVGVKAEELGSRAGLAVGCDLVESHLKQNESLHVVAVADAGRLPFSDSSFDLVSANMVVEHLRDPKLVFSEIARVLAPGGHFVFVTPNRSNPAVFIASIFLPSQLRRRLAELVDSRDPGHVFHTYYRANSVSSIRAASVHAKLSVQEIDLFNSFPMARRPWPATVLESFWIKTISRPVLRHLTSNVYAVLQKDPAA